MMGRFHVGCRHDRHSDSRPTYENRNFKFTLALVLASLNADDCNSEARCIFAGNASKRLGNRFGNKGPCWPAQQNAVKDTTCWHAAIFLVLFRIRRDPTDFAARLLFDLRWLMKEQRIGDNYSIHDLVGRIPNFNFRWYSFAVCRVRGQRCKHQ